MAAGIVLTTTTAAAQGFSSSRASGRAYAGARMLNPGNSQGGACFDQNPLLGSRTYWSEWDVIESTEPDEFALVPLWLGTDEACPSSGPEATWIEVGYGAICTEQNGCGDGTEKPLASQFVFTGERYTARDGRRGYISQAKPINDANAGDGVSLSPGDMLFFVILSSAEDGRDWWAALAKPGEYLITTQSNGHRHEFGRDLQFGMELAYMNGPSPLPQNDSSGLSLSARDTDPYFQFTELAWWSHDWDPWPDSTLFATSGADVEFEWITDEEHSCMSANPTAC